MADGTRDLIPSEEADGASSRAALFRFDPGWPFVIAGLALIVSAVLIPAQRELHDLEQKLAVHHAHEERAKAEILAYEQFNAEIEQGDERLLERLVRAQLNRMPKDERPLLLMPSANDTVPMWIESSVAVQIPEPTPYPDTLLSRIATGPRRLWVLATGAFLVFVGVMFAPSVAAPRGLRRRTAPVPQPVVMEPVVMEPVVMEPVVMEPVVMEPVVTDPVAAASSADTVAATTAGSVVAGAGTLDVETDAAEAESPEAESPEAESPEAESPEADAFQPQAIECELDDGARFGAEVVESESTEADCTSAETLDSALGTVAIFEAQDVHELQYAESPVHLGCEGSERDGVADDEVAGDEVAGNDVAGDEGSGNDLADDEVADDGGEEIARAETVAMSEDPSDASSAEVVVEPPLMEIETFPPTSFGSTSAERTADPLSLFSGIADDRWIDTRAR
jgi:hypothetical protein